MAWRHVCIDDPLPVHREGLEELRSLSHRFWMLNDDTNRSRTRPVRYLDPVAANAEKKKKILV